jgi:hypothetical protein
MTREILSYEEVAFISLLICLASVILSLFGAWLIKTEGKRHLMFAVGLFWFSAYGMMVALLGDVMYSILRDLT